MCQRSAATWLNAPRLCHCHEDASFLTHFQKRKVSHHSLPTKEVHLTGRRSQPTGVYLAGATACLPYPIRGRTHFLCPSKAQNALESVMLMREHFLAHSHARHSQSNECTVCPGVVEQVVAMFTPFRRNCKTFTVRRKHNACNV